MKYMQLHARRGRFTVVEDLIQQMREMGVEAKGGMYDSLLLSYCRAGKPDQALSVFREYKLVLVELIHLLGFWQCCKQFTCPSTWITIRNYMVKCIRGLLFVECIIVRWALHCNRLQGSLVIMNLSKSADEVFKNQCLRCTL